jgi:hypothetical protein
MPAHKVESVLADTFEIADPLVKKTRQTVQNTVVSIDKKVDYVDYYWLQPVVKQAKSITSKTIQGIKDFINRNVTWLLLIIVNILMVAEATLDTFLPQTVTMRARVISSGSTTKERPLVRIKRHLVSVVFRPLYQVTQIPLVQTMFTKTFRIAVFLSDEILGEKFTDAVLDCIEACIPKAMKSDKPGLLRSLAQNVVVSYQGVVAQHKSDVAMAQARSYIPAWQAGK